MTDRPLKVVMPMLTFVPSGMGGTETFARALLASLRTRADVAVSVLVSSKAAGAFPGTDEMVVSRVHGGSSTLERVRTLAQASLPGPDARALIKGADVVHYPFTVPLPRPQGVPWVQSLHDVQHLDLPEMFTWAERQYRKLAYDRAAKAADRVVTISEFSKQRIVHHLQIPEERVDVAPLGVDLDFFTPYDGPREPFVFFPATAWPHKNHPRLFEAMRLVRAERPELKLVLTGGNRAALGALPDGVKHRGFVSKNELRAIYRSASCLVYPSLYEGFGLPPLEAMASGLPVTAAHSGSLPEVCGDAALLFDPRNPAAIAHGILGALSEAQELRQRGLVHVRQYTWSRCCDAHVRAFQATRSR